MSAVHPDLQPLSFLLGDWEGEGEGRYPTIEGFSYRESVSLAAPPGKPFLVYQQLTWRTGDHPEAGSPLHSESGFIRPGGPGLAEMVLAQPTGLVEVLHGNIVGQTVLLKSTEVVRTLTAKNVITVERNLMVEDNVLSYELLMGAVGHVHQVHLTASLERVS